MFGIFAMIKNLVFKLILRKITHCVFGVISKSWPSIFSVFLPDEAVDFLHARARPNQFFHQRFSQKTCSSRNEHRAPFEELANLAVRRGKLISNARITTNSICSACIENNWYLGSWSDRLVFMVTAGDQQCALNEAPSMNWIACGWNARAPPCRCLCSAGKRIERAAMHTFVRAYQGP